MTEKLNVLFLCTGNSCRSQMAEGWANELKNNRINAFSAGIETHGLNPNAVKVMSEVGLDISQNQSKLVKDLGDVAWDLVITLCGHANETCPYFPGPCKVVHVGFDDPPKMAEKLAAQGESVERQLDCYRKVRDEIKAFVEKLPENILGD
ncbi:MAG: arsenate reductase ArsC [Desulfobacterales bacterium]|nr:arsenate reductase ArsC [Desulfobacterales bacterium]